MEKTEERELVIHTVCSMHRGNCVPGMTERESNVMSGGPEGLYDDVLDDGLAAGRQVARLHPLRLRAWTIGARRVSRNRATGAANITFAWGR